MLPPKVFVSHSHVDDAFAERLVKDLRAAGADAWLDKEDLLAGNFQQRISEALANCQWFVLVLTRSALSSPWVQQEVDAANRLKHQGRIRDLIFIQAGPVEHRELPALWGVYNIIDATASYEATRDRLLRTVGLALLGMQRTEVYAVVSDEDQQLEDRTRVQESGPFPPVSIDDPTSAEETVIDNASAASRGMKLLGVLVLTGVIEFPLTIILIFNSSLYQNWTAIVAGAITLLMIVFVVSYIMIFNPEQKYNPEPWD